MNSRVRLLAMVSSGQNCFEAITVDPSRGFDSEVCAAFSTCGDVGLQVDRALSSSRSALVDPVISVCFVSPVLLASTGHGLAKGFSSFLLV